MKSAVLAHPQAILASASRSPIALACFSMPAAPRPPDYEKPDAGARGTDKKSHRRVSPSGAKSKSSSAGGTPRVPPPPPPPPPPSTPPPPQSAPEVTPGNRPGVTSGKRPGVTPGGSGANEASPAQKPRRPCPVNPDADRKTAEPLFRVQISTSESGDSSDSSSYSYVYTWETDSEPEDSAKRQLREKTEWRHAEAKAKAQSKKKKMESRIPEFQPKATGDLSAFDEREEDWEKYKEQGGQKDHDQFCSDQKVAGFEAYLRQELKISSEASERDFAEAQWYLLLKDALKASMIHLKRGEDFKVGTRNQKDLEGQSYANMIASAVKMMKAQGDLKLKEMPDPEFLTTNMHKDWRPICDAETVQFLECENYVFADSVLKLGKTKGASSWVKRYEQALWWLPKESDLRLKTIHGQSFKYHWDVESGATTAGMLIKIKQLVDEKAGGDPSKFQDRVILFGCLNDLNDLPPLKEGEDPLGKTQKVAEETRDYIRRFRIGHFVWMGPGTEQVWQYDRRNPPIVWQPRADAFMKIIEDAGHPIFTGAVPSEKDSCVRRAETSTSLLAGTTRKCSCVSSMILMHWPPS